MFRYFRWYRSLGWNEFEIDFETVEDTIRRPRFREQLLPNVPVGFQRCSVAKLVLVRGDQPKCLVHPSIKRRCHGE